MLLWLALSSPASLRFLDIFCCSIALAIFSPLPLANWECPWLQQSVPSFPTEIKCVISTVCSACKSLKNNGLDFSFIPRSPHSTATVPANYVRFLAISLCLELQNFNVEFNQRGYDYLGGGRAGGEVGEEQYMDPIFRSMRHLTLTSMGVDGCLALMRSMLLI